jgi:hypothetical protein
MKTIEPIHNFKVSDAKKHGMTKAVILYTLRGWVNYKIRTKKGLHKAKNGKKYYFAYASGTALREQLPYLSKDVIRRALKSLEEKNIIISGQFNKVKWDKTNWYSFIGTEIKPENTDNAKCVIDEAKQVIEDAKQVDNTISLDISSDNLSAEQSSAKKKSSKKFSPSPSLIRKKVLIEKADAAAAQNSPVRVQNIENGVDGLEGTENLTYPKNFNKSEAINKMLSPYKKNGKEIKPQRHVSIVGLFILAKDMEITSEDQIKSIIKRNIRAASDLKPYSFKKIIKTMKYLKENADFKWTLESVSKFIDEDLEKINKSPGKILGEDVKIKD